MALLNTWDLVGVWETQTDTTAPVITLTPATATYNLTVGDALPSITATTDDGSTVVISGDTVDNTTAGSYVRHYDATDTSGNQATRVSVTFIFASTDALLVVEDGSVVPDANAYITTVELDNYWSKRGVTLNATGAQKQNAIIIATQYVDNNFEWRGDIVSELQSLDFPRSGVYDDENRSIDNNVVPKKLKYAVCEYAKRQLKAELQPDVYENDRGTIASITQAVSGAVSESITYRDGTGGYYGIKRYPMADNYLKGLVIGGIRGSFSMLRRN